MVRAVNKENNSDEGLCLSKTSGEHAVSNAGLLLNYCKIAHGALQNLKDVVSALKEVITALLEIVIIW